MNEVRLYKNPYPYPQYGSISLYKTIQATPRNQNLRSGYINLQLTPTEIMNFNYIGIVRGGRTLYAWVKDVETISGDRLFRVHYDIDSFRTYRNDLNLGTQYIKRSMTPTLLQDDLLSSPSEVNDYTIESYDLGVPHERVCVVQRRMDDDEVSLNTPAQPSPYKFYFCKYDLNNWYGTKPIRDLINLLAGSYGETTNIVTVYSIPYVNMVKTSSNPLPVKVGGNSTTIDGWRTLSSDFSDALSTKTKLNIPSGLTKTNHNVSVVIPGSGIINIPTDMLYIDDLYLRQDIDIYSGACNYMITKGANGFVPTHLSVRGSSLSSIPILSDPYDTYVSQNQNTLAVSLLGDVASLAGGLYTGDPGSALRGSTGLLNTFTSLEDAKNSIPSNPPAFLGSALVHTYNQKFYLIINKRPYDNESLVRARFGYPLDRVGTLTIPSSGFIQTQNCNISSNGNVPLWAIHEINQLFDNGILFK